jgi:hypothetical protein
MIIKHHVFAHYSIKTHLFLIFFVTKFQNHGNEHDHGLLWIKDTPICGINTNEEINFFVNRYISSDVSYYQLHYKMHNNINTLEHVRKQSCCL